MLSYISDCICKAWTLVRFEKEKLGTKQTGAGKIVFRDACDLLGEADVGTAVRFRCRPE